MCSVQEEVDGAFKGENGNGTLHVKDELQRLLPSIHLDYAVPFSKAWHKR